MSEAARKSYGRLVALIAAHAVNATAIGLTADPDVRRFLAAG